MAGWTAKKFWKDANAIAVEGGFTVQLDGRPVKTPAKAALIVPTMDLAREIAAEWDAQDETVKPITMPFTRSANAAIDKVTIQHEEVADMIADYGDSDLLCYRADSPRELCLRQAEAWDPLLDWADKTFNARLKPRTGVIHAPQDPRAVVNLRRFVHAFDAFELTAIHDLVGMSGSLIIGLAAAKRFESPEALWEKSRVDERWQAEQWGEDDEAMEVEAKKKNEFLHAVKLFGLTK
ncbi:MAG: ATP12 family protein [Paracoccaceae bacterium]|nr:ATP12 family protein [Paracoccaceae bacterium]MDG2260498.1 ATP12 family protein [Paracoccaceae bacterium]